MVHFLSILFLAFIANAQIVVTTTYLADLTREITGESVISLMSEGVDPHTYRPTPGDIEKLMKAELIIAHGFHLEGRMAEFLVSLKKRKNVILVEDLVEMKNIRIVDGAPDPHIWFDVLLWRDVAIRLGEKLKDRYPNNNSKAYAETLLELDAWIKTELSGLSSKTLVTAHDAFGYFGAAYGFKVYGVQGLSTESEASLKHIEDLVSLLVEEKVPAVFFESTVSERTVKALIEGALNRGHNVKIGGELYSDAIKGSYIDAVRHNVNTIKKALND